MELEYSPIILKKAKRLEQLLLRIEAGESLEEANEALDFKLNQKRLASWQAKYEAAGRSWEALIDGRQGHPTMEAAILEWLYARKEADKTLRAPQLADEIEDKFGVRVTDGHINYLLRKRGLSAPPGRPYKQKPAEEESEAVPSALSESIDNAGLFFPRRGEERDGDSRKG